MPTELQEQPRRPREIAEIRRLFEGFDTPFGLRKADLKAKIETFLLAVRDQDLGLVERAVNDFLSGAVARRASLRGKLPTSDEFGSHLRSMPRVTADAEDGMPRGMVPPFGPDWAAFVLRQLLAGPEQDVPPPSRFIAAKIAEGGDIGKRYHRDHVRQVGFPKVVHAYQRAEDARGVTVPLMLKAMRPAMEAVPVGSEIYEEWRCLFDRRGWPWLPDAGKLRVVWLPKGGPLGLADFEAALRNIEGIER